MRSNNFAEQTMATNPSMSRARYLLIATLGLVALISLPAKQTFAATPDAKTYNIMVFSKPIEGKDAEFNRWYNRQHVPDLLKVPGFQTAQRFITAKSDTPTSTLPPYLVIYEVKTKDLNATNNEVKSRIASGKIIRGAAFDYPASVTVIFEPLGPRMQAKELPGTTPAMKVEGKKALKTFYFMVFSNPRENREDEYNTWYDTQHLPDVLHIPGFVWGQRYKLADNETPGTTIPRYLVSFEFKSYDLDATIAEIKRRAQTGLTRMSTATAPDMMVYYLSPLGPLVQTKNSGMQ